MSDTPRTDAEVFDPGGWIADEVVRADFARQFERDLKTAESQVDCWAGNYLKIYQLYKQQADSNSFGLISVREKLPSLRVWVLAAVPDAFSGGFCILMRDELASGVIVWHDGSGDGDQDYRPTHWMYLPSDEFMRAYAEGRYTVVPGIGDAPKPE